jgi:hypothetical protein
MVAEALRGRLGWSSDVFIDNQSIGPEQPFAQVLEDGVRHSAVLVALIGQQWTEPPFIDRLFTTDDWVRREILLAKNQEAIVVPVLVTERISRQRQPFRKSCSSSPASRPARSGKEIPKTMMPWQAAALVPPDCQGTTVRAGLGVENARAAVENLLKRTLPPAQQWSGNRDRLVDSARPGRAAREVRGSKLDIGR